MEKRDNMQNFVGNINWYQTAQNKAQSGWENQERHSFNSGQEIVIDDNDERT